MVTMVVGAIGSHNRATHESTPISNPYDHPSAKPGAHNPHPSIGRVVGFPYILVPMISSCTMFTLLLVRVYVFRFLAICSTGA